MRWYHSIDLGGGIVTPGHHWDHLWGPLKAEMSKIDFRGKRVLDIGSWDGMWAFEAEKLGADEVVATDIPSQRSFTDQGPRTFMFARKHLGSLVEYRHASVYDLDSLFGEEFDIVTFFGVLYHLRYPQLGVAKIRKVLRNGGLLLLETSVISGTSDALIQTDHRRFHPEDPSTWNSFSVPALLAMLDESYLRPEYSSILLRSGHPRRPLHPIRKLAKKALSTLPGHGGFFTYTRGFVVARAFRGEHPHHAFPDTHLGEYFEPLS